MPFFSVYADNNYTESQSYAGARNQVPKTGFFNGVATTNLLTATAGTTAVLSDFMLLPSNQLLDIGVIYTAASGAVTTPAQLSLSLILPGGTAATQPASVVGYEIPTVANVAINTILWYSLGTPYVVNNQYPTPNYLSLQGSTVYPLAPVGSQIRLLVDVIGVGGVQTVRFAYRFRERDPGQPAPVAVQTAAINFPNP